MDLIQKDLKNQYFLPNNNGSTAREQNIEKNKKIIVVKKKGKHDSEVKNKQI